MDAMQKYLLDNATSVQLFNFDRGGSSRRGHGPNRGRNGNRFNPPNGWQANNAAGRGRHNNNGRYSGNRGRYSGNRGRGANNGTVSQPKPTHGQVNNSKGQSRRQLKYELFTLKKQLENKNKNRPRTNRQKTNRPKWTLRRNRETNTWKRMQKQITQPMSEYL